MCFCSSSSGWLVNHHLSVCSAAGGQVGVAVASLLCSLACGGARLCNSSSFLLPCGKGQPFLAGLKWLISVRRLVLLVFLVGFGDLGLSNFYSAFV